MDSQYLHEECLEFGGSLFLIQVRPVKLKSFSKNNANGIFFIMGLFNPTPGIKTWNIFCFLVSVRGTSYNYLWLLSLKCSSVILLYQTPYKLCCFNRDNLCLMTPGYHNHGAGLQWGWDLELKSEGCLQELVAQRGKRWMGKSENKETEMLLASSFKIQFVLGMPCSFCSITSSIEKENEAMWCISMMNSCKRRRKHEDNYLEK